MLYKKFHRQYLRDFRIGKEFKFVFDDGEKVHRIIREPYINIIERSIAINCNNGFVLSLISFWSGREWNINIFKWLN